MEDDELSEDDKTLIVAALDVLNVVGRPAALFLHATLRLEEHAEAEAWIAAYFRPLLH
jgi:hypothetical protein